MKKILRATVTTAALLAVGILGASAPTLADGIALETLWQREYPAEAEWPPVISTDGDGGVVIASESPGNLLQLRSWSASGEERWSGTVPGSSINDLAPCGENRLCLLATSGTLMLAADSGEVLEELPRATVIQPRQDGGWLLFDSGGFCGMAVCVSSHTLSVVDADGAEQQHELRGEDGAPLALTENGEVVTVVDGELHTLSLDGTLTPFLPGHGPLAIRHRLMPAGPHAPGNFYPSPKPMHALAVDDSQIITLLGRCVGSGGFPCPNLEVVGLRSDAELWSLDTGIRATALVSNWQFQHGGEGEFMALVSYDEDQPGWSALPPVNNRLLIMKATTSGEVIWQRRLLSGDYGFSELVQLPDSDALGLIRIGSDASRVLITLLDADDGDLRGEYMLDCDDLPCHAWRFNLDNDGLLAAVGAGGSSLRVVLAELPAEPAPGIALDQAALNGAWYAPRSSGQGFNLRLHPTSEDDVIVFMPWFTFTPFAFGSPDQLQWYSLDSRVQPGARSTELAVVQVTNGRFVEPGQRRTTVGQARLWFPRCDLGLLDYHFDGEHIPGGSGVIALRPLLPAGDDCIEADGSTVAAQRTINNAISGTWYDPAAPGQGLDIQHLGGSADGDDILFGTWHTFDAAEPTDNPFDQHWFTIQATGGEGPNGAVRATIHQTLGGRLDNTATDQHRRVGEVDLEPQACDRMRLRYRFDDNDDAGLFRSLSGEIELYRLGDCPPP